MDHCPSYHCSGPSQISLGHWPKLTVSFSADYHTQCRRAPSRITVTGSTSGSSLPCREAQFSFKKLDGHRCSITRSCSPFPGFSVLMCPPSPQTGGAAVIFPTGWKLVHEEPILPGRIIGCHVQLRGHPVYLVSSYFHPDELDRCCSALKRHLLQRDIQKAVIVGGDFNGAASKIPAASNQLLDEVGLEVFLPKEATYVSGPTASTLDEFSGFRQLHSTAGGSLHGITTEHRVMLRSRLSSAILPESVVLKPSRSIRSSLPLLSFLREDKLCTSKRGKSWTFWFGNAPRTPPAS